MTYIYATDCRISARIITCHLKWSLVFGSDQTGKYNA